MDLIRLQIPYDFVRSRVQIDWNLVLFGLEQELLDPRAASQFAKEVFDSSNRVIVSLTNLNPDADPTPDVRLLTQQSSKNDPSGIEQKWLFIVLDWIFENKSDYTNPLEAVAEVYADFNYPEQMVGFIYYMPSDESLPKNRELCIQRLIQKWETFVNECRKKYRPLSPNPL